MIIHYSGRFLKSLHKLQKSNPSTLKKIGKSIKYFSQNPNHPSLKLHKLGGNLKDYYSFSASSNIRIIFTWKDEDTILLYKIGTHDEVYLNN